MHKNLIDLHTHGIGKYDTKTENPDDILKMAMLYAKAGTAAFLPTIYSGTIRQMRANMEAVKAAIIMRNAENRTWTKHRSGHDASLILGVHLEGPFLNPARCGAQEKKSLTKPTIADLKRLIEDYEEIIKIMTIAPEMPGALKVIEMAVSLGIKVNMGHSDATYGQALSGKKAGATGISHIFNAMRPFHHREPGIAGFGLLEEDVFVEVVADGIHLDPKTLSLIFKIKRADRVILVSDSIKGAGVKKGPIKTSSGSIAGSAVTLSGALKNIKDAGGDALKFASENPLNYLNLRLDSRMI
ncbi:MAG: amidohydrolase family protein [Nitrospirae bacterium]|nr:amidohydrolase family protein [Nitrospirota bacterium]